MTDLWKGEKMGKYIRLDRFLATYAGMTRKEAKEAVRRGRVDIDGVCCREENSKVPEPEVDDGTPCVTVTVDGVPVMAEKYVYYMLNKPQGVVSATRDNKDRTVLDLVDAEGRELFPVGRLDKDTEGLLILTDDGELAHRLLSPRYHAEKTYEVHYDGELAEDAVEQMLAGIDIGEKKRTKPARLQILKPGMAYLTITEGKFHQVKRMIAAMGGTVTYLKRLQMAGLALDETLAPGVCRRLSADEVQLLREAAKTVEPEALE